MSIAKDLETYKSVFGVNNIVYSKSVTFIYDEKGKRRKIYSSLFLTPEHMSIISTTNDFKYRIPLDNISDLSTEGRVLKYYIHLVYGNQDKHYIASIDFTTKSDGDAFISLLNLAKSVDNKRQELD